MLGYDERLCLQRKRSARWRWNYEELSLSKGKQRDGERSSQGDQGSGLEGRPQGLPGDGRGELQGGRLFQHAWTPVYWASSELHGRRDRMAPTSSGKGTHTAATFALVVLHRGWPGGGRRLQRRRGSSGQAGGTPGCSPAGELPLTLAALLTMAAHRTWRRVGRNTDQAHSGAYHRRDLSCAGVKVQTQACANLRSKVQGYWNLHRHVPKDIDFLRHAGIRCWT